MAYPYRLPQLRTDVAPDVAGANRNALIDRRIQQTTQNLRTRNQLMGQQSELAGKQIENYDEDRRISMEMGALSEAVKAKTPEEARRRYESLGGADKNTNFSRVGDDVLIDGGPGGLAVQGPEEAVSDIINEIGNYPQIAQNQEWFNQLMARAAKSGVSVKQNAQDKSVNNIGKSRTRHEKAEGRWFEITQEYDGDAWNVVDRKPMYKQTETQAATSKRKSALGRLESMPPMKAYASGVRMNDDGSVYQDPITQAPVRLKTFTNTLGKRANMKIIKQVGEHVDDAIEVYSGLQDPTVQADLKQASSDGMWDKVEGRWSNAVKAWMMRNGISGNSKTFKTIMHMQRMASEQRKTMLGTAVTQTELQSILAWMPNAGDSYETMQGKITLAAEEGYEEFKRWLDINKNESNMAPFYNAWNLDRFNMPKKDIKSLARSGMAGDAALPQQSALQVRGDELEAQGMDEAEIIKTLQKEFPRRADGLR